ncbi:DUF418 domain-containing protein [Nocardiopsis sp. NPDC101807]|uniref:DUF418 domain-containing protein n=1 Tax=Nocardiopsis sp. NPDC101807 TaxID=3364339 RepID=UPI0037FBBD30
MSPNPGTAGAPPTDPAPTPVRSLAPDLARGFMLVFIALVNAQFFLVGPDPVRTFGDQAVAVVQLTLVNARAVPLFAFLFGYGAVRIMGRVRAGGGGWIHVRRLLRRRGWVMLAIGAVHGVLLLPVDIVGAYGLALLLFVGLTRARDAVLLWTAGLLAAGATALNTALTVALAGAGGETSIAAPSLTEAGFLAASAERFREWLLYTPVTMLTVAMPMIALGVWAARRRILEEPGAHRPLLVRTAVIGLGAAVAAGLPSALVYAELVPAGAPLPQALLELLHDAVGWFGGLGWAALFALLAARWEGRRAGGGPSAGYGPAVSAVAAVGQRSLTCYLAQSVVFTLVFAPYGAGLGATLGVAGAAAVAVATWLATVVLAEVLRRAGRRGPAEAVLRRLTYAGSTHAPSP